MSVFGRIELLNLAGEAFGVRVRDFLPLGLIGTISATLFLLDGLRKVQLESEPNGNITSLEPGLMQNWIAASLLSCCLAGIFNRMAAMSFLALLIFRLDSARAPLEMSGALENRIGLGPFKLPVRM